MSGFAGLVAFVTGASSGIGEALAREFADQGADIALFARRADRLEALAREIQVRGRRAIALAGDVTRDGDLEAAIAQTRARLGPVAVLVANAGFGVLGRLDQLSLTDYRRQLETNVFGVLRTIYAGLEDLKSVRGRLVLIGSVNAYLALAGSSPYSMSKFALRALADSLRHELARDGVSVTLVNPGFVESEIHQVDNQGIRHPEITRPVPAWLRMSAPRAARLIARAVRRRRPEIGVTGHGKLAIFLQRHAPALLSGAIRRAGITARRGPGSPSA